MPKIHAVTAVYLDFDSLSKCTDDAIFGRMRFALSLSKKRLFPRTLKCTQYRVERAQNFVTIHLLDGDAEKARFSFVPPPTFGGRG